MTANRTDANSNRQQLDKLRSREPYTVPDGFFEAFQEATLRQIRERQGDGTAERKHRFVRSIRMWLYGIPAAAAIAVIALNIFTPKASSAKLTPDQAFERLSDADQEYLLDNFRSEMAMDYAEI